MIATIISLETTSLRINAPAKTDTTVVRFEKTVVFATGKCVFAKLRHRKAITDENTPRYNIETVYEMFVKGLNILIGLFKFSIKEIKRKEIIPIKDIAYVRSKVENSVDIFLLEMLYPTDENTAPRSNITPGVVTIPSDFPKRTAITTPATESIAKIYCEIVGFSLSIKIPDIIETTGIIETITPEKELLVICMP